VAELSKFIDIRTNRKTEIGNINEVSGDRSLGFFGTDKGYRVILDAHNMKRIADHYNSKAKGKK